MVSENVSAEDLSILITMSKSILNRYIWMIFWMLQYMSNIFEADIWTYDSLGKKELLYRN